MRRLALALILALSPALAGHAAMAQEATLARVRAAGVLRCAAAIRPGIAFPTRAGEWNGLAVDLCQAIAVAAIGPKARIAFRPDVLPANFAAIGRGEQDVAFLTASEMIGADLLGKVLPGPAVFIIVHGAMVPAASPVRQMAELVGHSVCAEPGTGPERSVVAWFEQRHLQLDFSMFQESVEMLDAFHVGRCAAVVHELPSLAAIGLNGTPAETEVRILPEPLSAVPLLAATPITDGQWATIVNWTIQTILRAEQIGTAGPGGGKEPLPLDGSRLGLADDWQDAVIRSVGSYADIYARNLGDRSPLHLPRGLNAAWSEGGLMLAPYSE